MQRINTYDHGMTLVELTIVTVVMAIIIPVFAVVLISTYKDAYQHADMTRITDDTVEALQNIEDNVRVSSEYMVAVPSPYTDSYGPHNSGSTGGEAWSYKGNSSNSRVLILRSYATTVSSMGPGRMPVYKNTVAFNCTTQKQYQPKLEFLTIFFVRNGTLYRRNLTDTTTSTCGSDQQSQQQSCPPDIARSSWSPGCLAADEVMATGVTNFDITYFQDTYVTSIDAYNSNDPSVLQDADYITVTLTLTGKQQVTQSAMSMRITRINH